MCRMGSRGGRKLPSPDRALSRVRSVRGSPRTRKRGRLPPQAPRGAWGGMSEPPVGVIAIAFGHQFLPIVEFRTNPRGATRQGKAEDKPPTGPKA